MNIRGVPAKHLLLVDNGLETESDPIEDQQDISIPEAVSIYVQLKGRGMSKISLRTVERTFEYLIECCGEKDLNKYTKADAVCFRNALLARELTGSSIARMFSSIRSVFNLAMSEKGT